MKNPKLTMKQKQMLENAYFTPGQAGSFTNAQTLMTTLKLKKRQSKKHKRGVHVKIPSLEEIKLWLLQKRAFTLHRPARKKYPMKKVIVGGVNIQLQMDLIDMQQWALQNEGYRYILLAIDCFSRYAYCQPLKTKQGVLVAKSIETILNEAESRVDRKIKKIQTDDGTEFFNRQVKELLADWHITLFSTKSPTKAQMVERLIRTLRTKQERYNTFKGTRRWLESFPMLLKSYNKTIHSTLPKDMTPADVNLKNERLVWKHLYGNILLKTPKRLQKQLKALKTGKAISLNRSSSQLNVGDPVRLSKRKKMFEKAYYQNYTDEIFFIARVKKNTTPHTYKISDIHGEILEGIFYRQELTPVRFDTATEHNLKGKGQIYAVEDVLKEEIRKDGKKYLFIKWRGYPDSDNQWIGADQFESIQKAL